MKTFSEVQQGDAVYFLIDTCSLLQEHGGNGIGFANPNYGLIICQRKVVSNSWEWRNPKTETGRLFYLRIDEPIMKGDRCLFGPHINEYGLKSDNMISITKEMGRKYCVEQPFGECYCSYPGYIFTTKEALEEKIRSITDGVEANLRRINEDLDNLL